MLLVFYAPPRTIAIEVIECLKTQMVLLPDIFQPYIMSLVQKFICLSHVKKLIGLRLQPNYNSQLINSPLKTARYRPIKEGRLKFIAHRCRMKF